jgi:vitamin B12 transporter
MVQPETVVTATKIETPVEQSPAPVTNITHEEIQQQQATDALEVLRDVPGFTVVQSGSRGGTASLFSRGGESNYNLLLIDGVRANLAGGDVDYANFTTVGIDRIEVVRGPQSALYGSDAISSVIQLFTPRGEGPPHAFLRFGGGNYDTFEEQVGVSGGTSLYGYYLAAERIDTNGHLSVNNDYNVTSIASRFDLQPLPSLGLTSTVRYIDSRFHFPTGSNGDRFDPRDPRQFSDRRRLIFGNRFVHTPTSWWQQTLQLGLAREESTFRDAFDGDLIDFGAFDGNSEERRLSADYTSHFFLPTLFEIAPTFSVGAYIEDEHFDQRSNSGGTIEKVEPSRNTQSGYAQLLLQWREQVFITSGFRVDDSSTFGTEVTPRFSAAYILPWTHTKLRGGYGEGIKAPTFVENFGIGSPFIIGNRDLKPEEAESWEVGIEQPVAYGEQEALLSLTYFSADYDNLIAFLFDANPNFVNVQRARSRGLEAGLRVTPFTGLTLGGTYTYLDTEVREAGPSGGTTFVRGKSLLRRPEHIGSFTVNYAWQRLNANFNITVKGDAIDADFRNFPARRTELDGYTKADLALSYRLFENRGCLRSLTVRGKVQNLFDEEYEEIFGFSSPGVNFLLGFVAEF